MQNAPGTGMGMFQNKDFGGGDYIPWPEGVILSCTTKCRRWFCSAESKGLLWEREREMRLKKPRLQYLTVKTQKAHHSSVWRAFKDSVSFSWHAIYKQTSQTTSAISIAYIIYRSNVKFYKYIPRLTAVEGTHSLGGSLLEGRRSQEFIRNSKHVNCYALLYVRRSYPDCASQMTPRRIARVFEHAQVTVSEGEAKTHRQNMSLRKQDHINGTVIMNKHCSLSFIHEFTFTLPQAA